MGNIWDILRTKLSEDDYKYIVENVDKMLEIERTTLCKSLLEELNLVEHWKDKTEMGFVCKKIDVENLIRGKMK
jgi:hypothetical protein